MKEALMMTACLFMASSVYGQVMPKNAGFEEPDAAVYTKTRYWEAEGGGFVCEADSRDAYKGSYSLKVAATNDGNHFFNQEIPFKSDGLRKYRMRCAVRTKGLKGRVQLGARVFDNEGATLTKTVVTLTELPDQEWTIAGGLFVSDKTAAKLRVFGNLSGTGEAWFDDVFIEEMPQPRTGPAVETALYVHEYFDIVYEKSVISDKNFIADLKGRTMYLCADSIGMDACRYILQYYTTPMLKDGHSFFVTAEEWKKMSEGGVHPVTGSVEQEMPAGSIIRGNIGYINIPTFISADEQLMQRYADSAQNIIARFDAMHVKGYVVDLSRNGGGNSLPMAAAVGPLIGDGVCGYSFSGDGTVRIRVYRDGAAGWEDDLSFKKSKPYKLAGKGKPIAVIYSSGTGSSGEVTATAFIGLHNAKSFGQPTAGATTRVDNFELSDGAYLNLASGTNADRNRKPHDGPIIPDVVTPDTESAIEAAVKWIMNNAK